MKQQKLSIWNSFDEFGLLLGLGNWSENGRELEYVRYPGETNEELKNRVLKIYENKSNSSYQGLINSLSRDLLTNEYNVVTQYHYFLTYEPYPQYSGIKVYASGSTGWNELTPQIRASGYSSATSGWIVWNETDIKNSDNTTSYGKYTQVLEFIGTSLPNNDTPIKVTYQLLDHYDENGVPTLNWYTDIDNPNIIDKDEYKFHIKKAETPNVNSQIVIHKLNNLKSTSFSGIFYTVEGAATSKLKEVANYLNKKHPVEYGKIPWDTTTWENSANLSQGVLPTLFDAKLPVDQSGNLESDKFIGGVAPGPNLYFVEIVKEEKGNHTGAYAYWYPRIYPGMFYISNTGYYLFESKQINYQTFSNNSGSIPSTNNPLRESMFILGASGYSGLSGQYLSELYRYPYGSGIDFTSTNIYRRRYPFLYKISGTIDLSAGNYYLDFDKNIISGVSLSTRVQCIWEHPNSSGIGKICSGYDLNPFNNDRESSILFFG